MKIETVDIREVKPDPRNARQHGERNLEAIRKSLETFGQQKPIVTNLELRVIAGNGTLEAARALGWTQVKVVRTDLEPTAARAFAIADNRTAELAEWNSEELAAAMTELGEIADLDTLAVGFTAEELEALVGAEPGGAVAGGGEATTDSDAASQCADEAQQYNLMFLSEDEKDAWYRYLAFLAREFPEVVGTPARIAADVMAREL